MKSSTIVLTLICLLVLIDFIFDLSSDTFIYFCVSFLFYWFYIAVLDALDRYEPTKVVQISLLDREDFAKIVDENLDSKI